MPVGRRINRRLAVSRLKRVKGVGDEEDPGPRGAEITKWDSRKIVWLAKRVSSSLLQKHNWHERLNVHTYIHTLDIRGCVVPPRMYAG